ncbi:MAG TPA: MASE1 domain-containing protein [Verrucomicrobiae bacterium]|nr:MASE1 domain-containing protein [Verrucomicrobiae bacterium]
MKSGIRLITGILALTAIYFACGLFGLSLAFFNKSASAVWPPTGLALAVLLLGGYRLWPGVFLGAFLVNEFTQGTALTSLGIAAGNTLEALAGAYLVNRFAGGKMAFDRTRTLFRFMAVAAVASTCISATLGSSALCLTGFARWPDFLEIWLTWWLGDMVSDVIVAPLLLIWAVAPAGRLTRNGLLEAAVLFLLVSAIGFIVFFSGLTFYGLNPSLEYLTIPPLLWASFRLGERGAISGAAILAVFAIRATLHGQGPFVQPDPNRSLLLLQVFMGAITLTALTLALVVSESRRVQHRLHTQEVVSRALNEASLLVNAAPKLLEAVAFEGRAICGVLWLPDAASHDLVCAELWHHPGPRLQAFAEALRAGRLNPSLGLPAQVWKTGEPGFLSDLRTDPGLAAEPHAFEGVLRSAFAFPLKLGSGVLGVIEIFSAQSREPEPESRQLLEGIGNQVAQFIERKRAEEAQARLAAIVESSADAIIGKTLDGLITSWNQGAERIFGYSAQEVLHKPISLLVPPELKEEQSEILESIRHGKGIRSYHTRRVHKSGILIDVSLTVSPIKDSSGRIIGASKFARDITEQKRTERALAEARETLRRYADDLERRVEERTAKLQDTIRSLDAFCYTIAHDLRAPLRAMIGFSVELLDRYKNLLDPEGQGFLQRIRSAGGRMDQLILDLLKLGRLNTADLVIEEVELEDAFTKVLTELAADIRDKHARVEIQRPLPSVQASSVILEQVLANLLSNALKFVPHNRSPVVRIRAEPCAQLVRIWIHDNGIGIREQHHNKLFQPFSRLVKDQEFPGTGIGLAIVSKGVERMGGRAGVESEPDKGSAFWIELAAAKAGH